MKGSGVRITLVLLLAAWAGVTAGVSFVATPAKFLAPSLTMPVALDVGRHTFSVLGNLELAAGVVAFALCCLKRTNYFTWYCLAAVWALVAAERFWLLPVLDSRVTSFLSGSPPAASYHHGLFIAIEAAKVLLLLAAATAAAHEWRKGSSAPSSGV